MERPGILSSADKWFGISQRSSSWAREIAGGLTTFAAMAYILAANPAILSATGMDKPALVSATAILAGLSTLAVGLWARFPLALAPGMGLNAYFAFTLCGAGNVPWQAGLSIVLVSGILFFILSMTPARSRMVQAFPVSLRAGISAGIGAFLLFLGLQNAGLIVDDPVTLLAGNRDFSLKLVVVCVGVAGGVWMVERRIPGSLLIAVVAVAFAGLFLDGTNDGTRMTSLPGQFLAAPASLDPIAFQFDWKFISENMPVFLGAVLTFLLVDLFDTTGTLVGVGQRAKSHGNSHEDFQVASARIMKVDAASTAVGAALGTSPVTSYIESCAGIESGARTGMASVVTGICFLSSLWLWPIILAIPPEATSVALIVVGLLMIRSLESLDFTRLVEYFPAAVCVFLIPMTFSISHGIALGYLCFIAVSILGGEFRKLSVAQWILGIIFMALLAFGA